MTTLAAEHEKQVDSVRKAAIAARKQAAMTVARADDDVRTLDWFSSIRPRPLRGWVYQLTLAGNVRAILVLMPHIERLNFFIVGRGVATIGHDFETWNELALKLIEQGLPVQTGVRLIEERNMGAREI